MRALAEARKAAAHAEKLLNEPPPPPLNVYILTRECVEAMDPDFREWLRDIFSRHHDVQIDGPWALHSFCQEHSYGSPVAPEESDDGEPHTGTHVWPLYDAFVEQWRAMGPLDPNDP
jgi:hypothetical protein